MKQNIGLVYTQEVKPKDGDAWTQTIVDIRTFGIKRKFLLRPEVGNKKFSILFNVAYKGESIPYIKVGELENGVGFIYDPIMMDKPLRFYIEDTNESEAVVPNQIAKVVCECDR